MADDGKKKTLGQKLKSSPAAKSLKEHGVLHTAKTLGRLAKEDVQDHYDKAMDYLFPDSTEHQQTRQEHFNQSHEIAVRSQDLPHAEDIVHTYHSKRMSAGTFREGNVSSIMNGFANRAKKLPPEGY